MLIEVEAGGSW